MKKLTFAVFAFFAFTHFCNISQAQSDAEKLYSQILQNIESGTIEWAYKLSALLVKDFQDTPEAQKSMLIKVFIANALAISYGQMIDLYRNGVQKAIKDEDKIRFYDLYDEAIEHRINWTRALTTDTKQLIERLLSTSSLEIRLFKISTGTWSTALDAKDRIEKYGILPSYGEIDSIQRINLLSGCLYVLRGYFSVDKSKLAPDMTLFNGTPKMGWVFLECAHNIGIGTIEMHVGLNFQSQNPYNKLKPSLTKEEVINNYRLSIEAYEKAKELIANKYDEDYILAEEKIQSLQEILKKFESK